jgi:aminopeptidase N
MTKKIFTLLLMAYCISLAGQNEIKDIAEKEKQKYASKALNNQAFFPDNYDALYMQAYWEVDPSVKFISGNVLTYFKWKAPSTNFQLSLNHNMIVDSVLYHGAKLTTFTLVNKVLTLPISNVPNPFPYTTDSVRVFYHGIPATTGYGSFSASTHGPNGTPVIWTLSEPYGASDWWPCKQDLLDKYDSVDIIVKTPKPNRVGSNGILINETSTTTHTTFHWKHRYPITAYLVAIGVSNYARFYSTIPVRIGSIPMDNYIYPEDSLTALNAIPNLIKSMQFYDTVIAPYPFAKEKYGHCQFGFGGGEEHQTMTFVTSFGFNLMAHELMHQWFGDKITCGSMKDIWLNEGFATYFSNVVYQYLPGQFPSAWNSYKSSTIASITSAVGGSVYNPDTVNVNRIFDYRLTYLKGSMVLHMLRWTMGDSAFFKGIRTYVRDTNLAYKYALTPQFITHMEAQYGQPLQSFFNDWIYGEGYPSYHFTWSNVGSNVSMLVNQTQSHPSVSFFEMYLPIKFSNGTQDTIVRLNHDFNNKTFNFNLNFTPTTMSFDPDKWIVSKNNTIVLSEETIQANTAEVKIYPNPTNDILNIEFGKYRPQILTIIDIKGKSIFKKDDFRKRDKQISIDTKSFAKGIYILSISTENGEISRKIEVR